MSVQGFGVHTAMWSMEWDRAAAEFAIPEAVKYGIDFLEITIPDPRVIDAEHTRSLLERHEVDCVCSLGMPLDRLPTNNPEGAWEYLKIALDRSKAIGAKALSGVVYGGIGQRTGFPPTEAEIDATARIVEKAANYANELGMLYGLEAVNRYENHILNTARQAVDMVERVGAPNLFVHLDTYHMNIEEKGIANGILTAREHLKYIHLSASDRGTPAPTRWPGTRSSRRSPPSASRAEWRWKASSPCRRRWRPRSPSGARWRPRARSCWARACRSCATRRASTG